ncbi:type II secretion system protein GspM [Thiocapsa roseopersicina]|uniref:General secretion pathway protein M n=1 Tax=Thiocapsa roseopersicina TaxID=1058 RepID=A0A1H2ZCN2_THIRO|nr:type II secretion system protein GspM [Thiocapsa roseopersicina]SDX15097.1 general secretion pathway protein M [Thiocapsa roseopersicina]
MKAPSRPKIICVLGWILLLSVPLLVIGGLAAAWSSEMSSLSVRIADSEDQLVRYRRMIRSLPELRAELERVRANESFKAFYFDAPTPALAGAELQRQVQDIVTAASGRLISTQILPGPPEESPPRVRVRTQIQGSTETLLDVLYNFEQARPFLFVDQVSVRSSARPQQPAADPRGRAIRRPPVNPAGELTIRLDIFGFTLGGDT